MQEPTEKPLKDYQSTIKMLLLSTTATVHWQDISFIEDSARLGKKVVTVYIYICVCSLYTLDSNIEPEWALPNDALPRWLVLDKPLVQKKIKHTQIFQKL